MDFSKSIVSTTKEEEVIMRVEFGEHDSERSSGQFLAPHHEVEVVAFSSIVAFMHLCHQVTMVKHQSIIWFLPRW